MNRVAVTGANGHVGRRLVGVLGAGCDVRAIVRSEAAAWQLRKSHPDLDVRIVDYGDASALAHALEGCGSVVHLVGILKQHRANRYVDAHERSCQALASASASAAVDRAVYLSIVGAEAGSRNACLASKGRAEVMLRERGLRVIVIRVPMVLGEGDYASLALARRARARVAFTFRAASLEQPIYAGDVVAAIVASLDAPEGMTVDLGGPESLTRRALTERAAAVLQGRVRVVSLPLGLGMAVAWLLERLTARPPITRAMLGVLDHDDRIPADDRLIDRVTPLDEMLHRCLE